jgi:hypothetical protein
VTAASLSPTAVKVPNWTARTALGFGDSRHERTGACSGLEEVGAVDRPGAEDGAASACPRVEAIARHSDGFGSPELLERRPMTRPVRGREQLLGQADILDRALVFDRQIVRSDRPGRRPLRMIPALRGCADQSRKRHMRVVGGHGPLCFDELAPNQGHADHRDR